MEQEYGSQQMQQPAQMMQEEDYGLQITDILALFLHNWKWFVLSVVVCLLAATIQVKRTTPVYTRSAQILIKEDGTKGSFSGNVDWFASLGMGSAAVNVQNELVAVQSPATFVEVVERLGLNTTYQRKGRWHDNALYGSTLPVILEFQDLGPEDTGALTLTIKRDGSVTMANFAGSKVKGEGKTLSAKIGQTVSTPVGRVKVMAGPAAGSIAEQSDEVVINVARTTVLAAAKRAAGGLSANLNAKENSIIDLVYHDTNTQRAFFPTFL